MTWTVCSYNVAENTNEPTSPGADSHGASGSGTAVSEASARRVLENLTELEPDLKAAAVIGDDGKTVASTGKDPNWSQVAAQLVGALDAAQARPVDSAHLATDDAEIFAVRENGLVLVAVTARFVLASLTGFDLRMALRDLSKGAESA
ncbi:MAG: hypothetical protein WBW44_01150 [Solirubrobacterales bacterium]